MLGGGADMAKMAGTILAVSVGVVALGSAIVFLADKVMSVIEKDQYAEQAILLVQEHLKKNKS